MYLYIIRTSKQARSPLVFEGADDVIRRMLDNDEHRTIEEILHYKYLIEDTFKKSKHNQLTFSVALIPSPVKPIPLYLAKAVGPVGYYFLYFCRFPAPWLTEDYDAKQWKVEDFVSKFVDEIAEIKVDTLNPIC